MVLFLYKNEAFLKNIVTARKLDRILEYILLREGIGLSLLFVVSIAIILLFVLFSLYYLITSKKEVPRQSLLEEEFDREE